MTAFNREAFIAEAIDSVLASTYTNFELIIVDDASTDRTFEIAEQYGKQDDRVRVFRNGANLGQFPNRNRAAELARGTYIKFLDSDDILYPNALDLMVRGMETFPSAGMGGSVSPRHDVVPYPILVLPREAYRLQFLVKTGGSALIDFALLEAIFRKDAFEAVGGFTGSRVAEDTATLFKVLARYPVIKLTPGAGWYRRHEQQAAATRTDLCADRAMMVEIKLEALTSEHCPLKESEKEIAVRRVMRHQRQLTMKTLRNTRNPVLAARLIRSILQVARRFGVPQHYFFDLRSLPSHDDRDFLAD